MSIPWRMFQTESSTSPVPEVGTFMASSSEGLEQKEGAAKDCEVERGCVGFGLDGDEMGSLDGLEQRTLREREQG